MRTALAWKNLTGEWRRLLTGTAGVCFAAVLMFMQNGFRNALLDSPVQLVEAVRGDLVATSVIRYAMTAEQRFPRDLLSRAGSDPDVAWVAPVMIERASARIRVEDQPRRSIRVIAAPLEEHLFDDAEIRRQLPALRPLGNALVDRQSKRQYGFARRDPERLAAQRIELLDRRVRVVGTFEIGTDFANDGNLLLSPESLAHYFPFRGNGDPLSVVDFGLIRLRPGADPEVVAARLSALAPQQWRVVPRSEIVAREIAFWDAQTPIGMIFFIGTVMGFAVGVIICYQILYTNIHDSLPELATLKAMGYANGFFMGVVVRQSIYLSVLGFVPALLVSWGLFQLLQELAGLPMLMTPERVAVVFLLTLAMCVVSGLLALRKLVRADPANLF
ncbi:FtsX-like permease family protein [Candidatus Laterigemmans baculatus]|uniref:FtsX-like permease family protein n=1 Tax=Candidatus Laterigemmans baculatus TaxID=2770505 RepID=UPI0013D8E88D|nr:FtsX-like permease family protein [Candidatus Laterigemmans baculatus]